MPDAQVDPGQEAYEADLKVTPRYAATKQLRPQWQDLCPSAQAAWREKAKRNA